LIFAFFEIILTC